MKNSAQHRSWTVDLRSWPATAALAIAILFAAAMLTQSAQAQTFTVLHSFSDGPDGAYPDAGLTMDRAGNLYGTTSIGGNTGANCGGCGTVFKLTHSGSGWVFNPIYSFTGGNDGASPQARVIFGPDGSLYGTTAGGGQYYSGVVFNLKPPPTACKSVLCPWTESVLYSFPGNVFAPWGDLVFDKAGNLYGVTAAGGTGNCYTGCGTVYKLTPSSGSWNLSAIYDFQGTTDGANPAGVVLDDAGNLYGTAYGGGTYNVGTVFELTPSGSGFTEKTLHSFQTTEAYNPDSGLIFDGSGNLYGSTTYGPGNSGTIFEMTPSGNGWTYTTLYNLPFYCYGSGPVGAPLMMEAAGDLIGTISSRDGCKGAAFKLTPGSGSWTFTSLHDFSGGSDGGQPFSKVVVDANGNLYGTTSRGGTSQNCPGGGASGCGVVWEITP